MVMRVSTLRKAARKMTRLSWGCCGSSTQDISNIPRRSRSGSVAASSGKVRRQPARQNDSDCKESGTIMTVPNNNKSLCAICLEPLMSCSWSRREEAAIFTSQECSHAFHFNCIASNVRHGSVTCPICRAHWTHLPRQSHLPRTHDPVLRILDDSIATFRVHRRSSSSSTRYDDDDPIHHHHQHQSIIPNNRLQFALLPLPLPLPLQPGGLLLSVKLAQQEATDIVLVVNGGGGGGGPQLRRLLKQALSLVVFSVRCIDRLAIVATHSSTSATRVLPLRRMTWHGKRTALQVIDRLFFPSPPMGMGMGMGMGHTGEPIRRGSGMKKGIKILEDRSHTNPHSCILHLSSDSSSASQGWCYKQHQVHHFHFDFDVVGLGISAGLVTIVMHRFEEFLARAIGGIIRDTHLKIDGEVVRLGELRGGEERRIPVPLVNQTTPSVSVIFSYIEGGGGGIDCFRTGEIQATLPLPEDKTPSQSSSGIGGGRTSRNLVESWDYHDTYMARRWAKHLHGYKP